MVVTAPKRAPIDWTVKPEPPHITLPKIDFSHHEANDDPLRPYIGPQFHQYGPGEEFRCWHEQNKSDLRDAASDLAQNTLDGHATAGLGSKLKNLSSVGLRFAVSDMLMGKMHHHDGSDGRDQGPGSHFELDTSRGSFNRDQAAKDNCNGR